MKAFAGQVRVLAQEDRGGKILRCVLRLLGSGAKAESKGVWSGWTKGPTIIDHVRQELGMAAFDAFSKMLMLGLVENPEPPQHKSDQWRLTAAGKDAYAVVQWEDEGEEARPAPAPADARKGKRREAPKPSAVEDE